MNLSTSRCRSLIAALLFILCTAFTQDNKDGVYPTIVLSEKYNRLGGHGEKAKTYYISASSGLLVDARSLKLSNAGKHPTKIFLISEGVIFVMPFSSEKIMIADALHLTNAQGIMKFEGYKPGKAFSMGVGELEVEGDQNISVKMTWACLLKVK